MKLVAVSVLKPLSMSLFLVVMLLPVLIVQLILFIKKMDHAVDIAKKLLLNMTLLSIVQ
jgi:hypothetical protein